MKPIILIKAEHDSVSSMGKTADAAKKLSSTLYLAINAKIMLLWNVNLSSGLVNGSTGIIKDFIFAPGKIAPDLPAYIVIEFDDYCGPKYFTKPGQEKWVPIEPETAKWGGQSEQDHFRKQFPITLAYALTVWKCQGLTIKGLVAVSLGESEKEHGLTFVALSRATDIINVYLGNGASFQRFQKIGDMPKLIRRVVEDGRLLQNEVETKEHFGTT
jgi:ATP-dependent exoDNAse (exonuclease V) alpha subunit